ncbi:MAG: hypothetical protein J7L38_08775, partial [Thermoproteales archaeon]|nr:hypothetical protein [Thermoproteales archaeon]
TRDRAKENLERLQARLRLKGIKISGCPCMVFRLFLELWELVWVSPSAASPLVGGLSGATFPYTTGCGLRGSAVTG